jgi:hypothetical protein
MKRIDVVDKPLEEQEIAGTSISSCDEKHGSQKDDDVGTPFVIGRHRWDVNCWFIHGDLIYDTQGESSMEEDMFAPSISNQLWEKLHDA